MHNPFASSTSPASTPHTNPNKSDIASGISGEFHNFISDVEDMIADKTSLTGEDFTRVKNKLTERVASAKAAMEDMGHNIACQARKGVEATNSYAHEKPWHVIGTVAVVGFLLGFFHARRT